MHLANNLEYNIGEFIFVIIFGRFISNRGQFKKLDIKLGLSVITAKRSQWKNHKFLNNYRFPCINTHANLLYFIWSKPTLFSFSLSALPCSLFSKEHGSSTGLCLCFLIILKGETISLTFFSINHSKLFCSVLGSLNQNEGKWWICSLVELFSAQSLNLFQKF